MMQTMKLDKEWKIEKLGDYWRHVNHSKRLATVGWKTKRVARQAMADGIYLYNARTIQIMRDRYDFYFGKSS